MEEVTDYGDTFAEAEPINSYVETIYADLTDGDWDYYSTWLDAGDRLIAMTQDDEGYAQAIDTYLRLYNPSGDYISYSNDFWGGTNTSHLFYTADEEGWWRVAVSGDGAGVTGEITCWK